METTENQTGENNAAAAAPAAGENTVPPAESGQQETNAQKTEDQSATVPVSVLQAMREEQRTLKDQLALYRTQLETARFQTPQQQPTPQQQAAPPADPFQGLADDDLLTVSQMKQLAQQMRQPAQGPSMGDAVGRVLIEEGPDAINQIKQYLPEMAQQNPWIAQQLQAIQDPYAALKTALSYARMNPKAQQQAGPPAAAPDLSAQIDRIIQNAGKPGSASAAGGQSGMGRADKIAAMSDAEFEAYTQAVKSGQVL